jgi:hypothetical protein
MALYTERLNNADPATIANDISKALTDQLGLDLLNRLKLEALTNNITVATINSLKKLSLDEAQLKIYAESIIKQLSECQGDCTFENDMKEIIEQNKNIYDNLITAVITYKVVTEPPKQRDQISEPSNASVKTAIEKSLQPRSTTSTKASREKVSVPVKSNKNKPIGPGWKGGDGGNQQGLEIVALGLSTFISTLAAGRIFIETSVLSMFDVNNPLKFGGLGLNAIREYIENRFDVARQILDKKIKQGKEIIKEIATSSLDTRNNARTNFVIIYNAFEEIGNIITAAMPYVTQGVSMAKSGAGTVANGAVGFATYLYDNREEVYNVVSTVGSVGSTVLSMLGSNGGKKRTKRLYKKNRKYKKKKHTQRRSV